MAEKKKPETGSTHEQYRRVLRTAYPDSNAPKSPEFAEKVASRHQFDPASLDRDCSCGWKACNSFRYVESYLKEAWKKHVAEARICPVCGEPMSLHSFERETNVSVCPAPAVSLPPIVLEPQESAVRWKSGDRVRFIVRPGGDHPYANAYTVTEIVGGLVMLAGRHGRSEMKQQPAKRLSILAEFLGTKCSGCGGTKRSRMSHCRSCYLALPPAMRQALYQRFGEGYEQAWRDSIDFLRTRQSAATEPKEQP